MGWGGGRLSPPLTTHSNLVPVHSVQSVQAQSACVVAAYATYCDVCGVGSSAHLGPTCAHACAQVRAVDSEHGKNLNSDPWRKQQVGRSGLPSQPAAQGPVRGRSRDPQGLTCCHRHTAAPPGEQEHRQPRPPLVPLLYR